MCLSIAIHRPHDVLATGHYRGYEWTVTNNGNGFRCGYVRVPAGHPWHGVDFSGSSADIEYPSVHGGITFSQPDVPCGKGGPDDAFWQGFDCVHHGDAPDPALPGPELVIPFSAMLILGDVPRSIGIVRTQAYVEAECRSLIDQAAAVADAVGFVPGPDHHHEACGVGGPEPGGHR
jgi:hypothetical protein